MQTMSEIINYMPFFKAYDKVTGADYKISNLILIFEEKHIKSSFF